MCVDELRCGGCLFLREGLNLDSITLYIHTRGDKLLRRWRAFQLQQTVAKLRKVRARRILEAIQIGDAKPSHGAGHLIVGEKFPKPANLLNELVDVPEA